MTGVAPAILAGSLRYRKSMPSAMPYPTRKLLRRLNPPPWYFQSTFPRTTWTPSRVRSTSAAPLEPLQLPTSRATAVLARDVRLPVAASSLGRAALRQLWPAESASGCGFDCCRHQLLASQKASAGTSMWPFVIFSPNAPIMRTTTTDLLGSQLLISVCIRAITLRASDLARLLLS